MSVWSAMNVILMQAVKTQMEASFASAKLVLQEMEQAAQVNMFSKRECNNTLSTVPQLQQILMSARLELSVVIQMQSVLILMVATPAPVHLDSLEME